MKPKKPMSDKILKWIESKEKIASSAAEGPWYVAKEGLGNRGKFPTVYATNTDLNYICQCADGLNISPTLNQENAAFIADSRTTTPLALEIARLAVEALQRIKNGGAVIEQSHGSLAANVLRKIQTLIES